MAVEGDRVAPGDRAHSGVAGEDGAEAVGIGPAWNCVGKTHPVGECNGYTWSITCLTGT